MEELDGEARSLHQDRGDIVRDLVSSGSVVVKKQAGTLSFDVNIDDNPYKYLPPEQANTVRKASQDNNAQRDKEIESVLQLIETVKTLNRPSGLVLKPDKVSCDGKVTGQFTSDEVIKVLGKGNSSGGIVLVKDRVTGAKKALKNVMLAEFNRDEVKAWVHLADVGRAPELYHFHLDGNQVRFSMEPLEGETLQDVVDKGMIKDPSQAFDFSLCILHDLLITFDRMLEGGFSHGDLHGGNVMVQPSMDVKLLDFGRARKLLQDDVSGRRVKDDIVEIIRMFCLAYSGYDLDSRTNASQIFLKAKDLSTLNQVIAWMPKENRKEIFNIMTMLFESVQDPKQEGFGDTRQAMTRVKAFLGEDLPNIRKKLAVILFPEKFQEKTECDFSDSRALETDAAQRSGDLHEIWDHPDMEEFMANVTDKDLLELGDTSLL